MQTSQCNGIDLAYRTNIPTVNEDGPILTARAFGLAIRNFTEEFFHGAVACDCVDSGARLFVSRESLSLLLTAIIAKLSTLGFCKISYSAAHGVLNVDFTVEGSENFDSAWRTELFAYANKYGFTISQIENGVRILVPASDGATTSLRSNGYDDFLDLMRTAYRIFNITQSN